MNKKKSIAPVRCSAWLGRSTKHVHSTVNPCFGTEVSTVPFGIGKKLVNVQIHLVNSNRRGLRELRGLLRRLEPMFVGLPHRIRIEADSFDACPLFSGEPRHNIGTGIHNVDVRKRPNDPSSATGPIKKDEQHDQ